MLGEAVPRHSSQVSGPSKSVPSDTDTLRFSTGPDLVTGDVILPINAQNLIHFMFGGIVPASGCFLDTGPKPHRDQKSQNDNSVMHQDNKCYTSFYYLLTPIILFQFCLMLHKC